MTPAGLRNLTNSIPLRGLLANVNDGRLHLQSAFRGCTRPQGGAVSLTAYMVPCVRFRPFVRFVSRLSSSRSATLGTGGWLDLTRQGLAPCKKRQACLGAHGFADERRLCCPLDRRGWPPLPLRHRARTVPFARDRSAPNFFRHSSDAATDLKAHVSMLIIGLLATRSSQLQLR
jgi:hypothetical protein